jgi:hypothetical protein
MVILNHVKSTSTCTLMLSAEFKSTLSKTYVSLHIHFFTVIIGTSKHPIGFVAPGVES